MAQGLSWQYCSESTEVMILHDAGRDQGGFGAAEGASQQLTVLREAAGFERIRLQAAGRHQGEGSGADGQGRVGRHVPRRGRRPDVVVQEVRPRTVQGREGPREVQ